MTLLRVIVRVVLDQGFICVSSVDRKMSLICEECQCAGGVEGDFPALRSHRVFLIHSTDEQPFSAVFRLSRTWIHPHGHVNVSKEDMI